jgi:MFS superfamily sulfate permease-like transporter
VLVIAFQAPLTFLNVYKFQDSARRAIGQSRVPLELIVLEASSIVEIDFTAAQILLEIIEECAQSKITFAIARLESVRAEEAFERFGITEAVHHDHFFHSVDEAIRCSQETAKRRMSFAMNRSRRRFGRKSQASGRLSCYE